MNDIEADLIKCFLLFADDMSPVSRKVFYFINTSCRRLNKRFFLRDISMIHFMVNLLRQDPKHAKFAEVTHLGLSQVYDQLAHFAWIDTIVSDGLNWNLHPNAFCSSDVVKRIWSLWFGNRFFVPSTDCLVNLNHSKVVHFITPRNAIEDLLVEVNAAFRVLIPAAPLEWCETDFGAAEQKKFLYIGNVSDAGDISDNVFQSILNGSSILKLREIAFEEVRKDAWLESGGISQDFKNVLFTVVELFLKNENVDASVIAHLKKSMEDMFKDTVLAWHFIRFLRDLQKYDSLVLVREISQNMPLDVYGVGWDKLRISCMPYPSLKDLPGLYSKYVGLLNHAERWAETAYEAMAFGRPVYSLSSAVSKLLPIFDNASLYRSDSIEDLQVLMHDKTSCDSKRLREYVLTNHTWDCRLKKISGEQA
jgi:hypothetical protein